VAKIDAPIQVRAQKRLGRETAAHHGGSDAREVGVGPLRGRDGTREDVGVPEQDRHAVPLDRSKDRRTTQAGRQH
jgi:hypothetical protein